MRRVAGSSRPVARLRASEVATERDAPDLGESQHRLFTERRRSRPVWPQSLAPGTGDGVTLYRFEDCARVLRDPQTFSSRGYEQGIDLVMGRTILSMDDPSTRATGAWSLPPFTNGP